MLTFLGYLFWVAVVAYFGMNLYMFIISHKEDSKAIAYDLFGMSEKDYKAYQTSLIFLGSYYYLFSLYYEYKVKKEMKETSLEDMIKEIEEALKEEDKDNESK